MRHVLQAFAVTAPLAVAAALTVWLNARGGAL